jgi:hypothetical protein
VIAPARRFSIAFALIALIDCASEPSHTKGGLVALPGVTSADVAAALQGRRVALIVGIDHFADPFWPALRFASKDATDLRRVLADHDLGAFDDLVVLTRAEDTTRARVLEELERLQARAPRAEDTLLVYISAHGTLSLSPQGPRRVLVMADTKHDAIVETGLEVGALADRFDKLPSRRKVLILATCHSGGGKSLLTPDVERFLSGAKGPFAPIAEISRASVVLSASDLGQAASEDDRLANDVYTHFLIEALTKGGDIDGDGAVSATEAHDYARRRTYEFTMGMQTPTIQSIIVGIDPVVLSGRPRTTPRPILYGYSPSLDGFAVLVNGRKKGVLPASIVLDPGTQEVELQRGQDAYTESLDVDMGDRIPAERVLRGDDRRFALDVGGSVFALFDSGVAGRVLRPMAGISASLRMQYALFSTLDLIADAGYSISAQSVRPADQSIAQSLSAIQLGVGALYPWDFDRGALRLAAGPHLSYLILRRSLSLPDLDERQSFGTMMPGVMLSGSMRLGRFELMLLTDLHYVPLVLDGKTRSIAGGSLSLSGGWRF